MRSGARRIDAATVGMGELDPDREPVDGHGEPEAVEDPEHRRQLSRLDREVEIDVRPGLPADQSPQA